MGWSEFDKLVSVMWKQMGKGTKGKSKGKGKGGQGGHGGSKGGKAQGKSQAAANASTDLACKCCGKMGYVKSEFRHSDKACDNWLGKPAISRGYAGIPRWWSMQAKTQQRGQQLLRRRRAVLQLQKSSSHHGFVEVVCIRMQTITWPNAKSALGRKPTSQSRPPHQNLLFGNRCST